MKMKTNLKFLLVVGVLLALPNIALAASLTDPWSASCPTYVGAESCGTDYVNTAAPNPLTCAPLATMTARNTSCTGVGTPNKGTLQCNGTCSWQSSALYCDLLNRNTMTLPQSLTGPSGTTYTAPNESVCYTCKTGYTDYGAGSPTACVPILDTVMVDRAPSPFQYYAQPVSSGPIKISVGPWSVNGTNVYYNLGKVGIGTDSPTAALQIETGYSGNAILAAGTTPTVSGQYAVGIGYYATATGNYAVSLGNNNTASGDNSTAMGDMSTASNLTAFAEGYISTASGISSVALGNGATASGHSSTALGGGTTASGDYGSFASGYDTTASGDSSTAMGNSTTASGGGSFAAGGGSTASGIDSTALGYLTQAQGNYSLTSGVGPIASGSMAVAFGNNTKASGNYSVALNDYTTAPCYVETVIGKFNMTNSTCTATTWTSTDPIFVIGNGQTNTTNSDAMVVYKNGTLAAGTGNYTLDGATPGTNAVALGEYNDATGNQSVALGTLNKASGTSSVAMGQGSTASGNYSIALGFANTSGNTAFASGTSSASGSVSTSMGWDSTASGNYSVAIGYATTASGKDSVALGNNSTAQAFGATAISGGNALGNTTTWVSTDPAFVVGDGNYYVDENDLITVLKNGQTTINSGSAGGLYIMNSSYGNSHFPYSDGWNYISGNGIKFRDSSMTEGMKFDASDNSLYLESKGTSDYWQISSNGNGDLVFNPENNRTGGLSSYRVWFNDTDGSAWRNGGTAWTNYSDRRLKDIHGSYEKGLNEIVKLNPVRFNYKANNPEGLPASKEYIGFVAQDVQPVFPETISKDNMGYLGFDMSAVNVAMVNAVKELKAENDELKAALCEIKPDAKLCAK